MKNAIDHIVLFVVLTACIYSFLHAVTRMLSMGNSHNRWWGICYFLIAAPMLVFFMNILGFLHEYLPYAIHALIIAVSLYMWLTSEVWRVKPPSITEIDYFKDDVV